MSELPQPYIYQEAISKEAYICVIQNLKDSVQERKDVEKWGSDLRNVKNKIKVWKCDEGLKGGRWEVIRQNHKILPNKEIWKWTRLMTVRN